LWLNILTFYQICSFFSAKPENIEEEFLQLITPAVAKFNAEATYKLLPVFSYTTYHCHFQENAPHTVSL